MITINNHAPNAAPLPSANLPVIIAAIKGTINHEIASNIVSIVPIPIVISANTPPNAKLGITINELVSASLSFDIGLIRPPKKVPIPLVESAAVSNAKIKFNAIKIIKPIPKAFPKPMFISNSLFYIKLLILSNEYRLDINQYKCISPFTLKPFDFGKIVLYLNRDILVSKLEETIISSILAKFSI